MATPRDEFELLCERCGYSIEGLPRETNCPECGRAVVESLLEVRPGTPWQRGTGPGAWLRTNWELLSHPINSMRRMAIEPVRSRRLLFANCLIASIPMALFVGADMLDHLLSVERPYWGEDSAVLSFGIGGLYFLCALLGSWAAQWLLFLLLTKVERIGLRTFSRARGTRITGTVATAITSHASVGWVVTGFMVTGGLTLGLALGEIPDHHDVQPFRGTLMLAYIWMPTVLGLLGLLTFETIVYAGILNCKFANRARPEVTPRHRAASASTPSPERQRDSTNPPGPTPEPEA